MVQMVVKNKILTCFFTMYLILTISIFILNAQGESESSLLFTLDHKFNVNEQGFILIEGIITISNLAETHTQLPSLIINYPREYISHIADMNIKGPTQLTYSISVNNLWTTLSISPKESYLIPSKSDVKLSIKFYLTNILKLMGSSTYVVNITSIPSINLPLKRVDSIITSPLGVEFLGLSDFNHSKIANYNYWSARFFNIEPNKSKIINGVLQVKDNPNFSIVKFPLIEREVVISPTGSITIIEMIKIENLADGTLSKLPLSLIDPSLTMITIIPETSPPLFEKFTQKLFNNTIDLQSISKFPLKKGSTLIFKYEYPLSKRFINMSENLISLLIPLNPPIQGVVSEFILKFNIPSGFLIEKYSLISDGKVEELPKGFIIRKSNASLLSDDKVSISIRFGWVWASNAIMPIANIIFIFSFLISLYLTSIKLTGEKIEAKLIDDLITNFEEKLSSIGELIHSLRDKSITHISKADIERVKKDIDAINSKVASRINEIKSGLISKMPEMQALISKLINADRAYDRTIKEFINLYERYIASRIGKEAMSRLILSHEKNIREATDQLLSLLDEIKRESKV